MTKWVMAMIMMAAQMCDGGDGGGGGGGRGTNARVRQ